MKPKETKWPAEPHTLAKHEILRRYLGAWFPILARYNGRIFFLDGFAGPGEYEGGEMGSPLIALNAALSAKIGPETEVVFSFVEKDQDRASHLQKKISAMILPKNFVVHTICGEF